MPSHALSPTHSQLSSCSDLDSSRDLISCGTGCVRSSEVLEAVIVTAGKRSEELQNLPASVLVATEERLSRTEVRDLDGWCGLSLLKITKTTQPANNSINIRGIGTYAFSIAAKPSVSVIVDEVTQPFQAQAFQALADVQQVEVFEALRARRLELLPPQA